MFRLLCAWAQIVTCWWSNDRIRASRAEGRLLHTQVGDRFVIGDRLWWIQNRYEEQRDCNLEVVYTLVEVESQHNIQSQLRCIITVSRLPYWDDAKAPAEFETEIQLQKFHESFEWTFDGRTQSLNADDVVCLSSSRAL